MAAVYHLLMTTFKLIMSAWFCLTGFRSITMSAVDFSGLPITSKNPAKFPSIVMYWCAAKNLAVQECQHGLLSQRNVFSIQWNPHQKRCQAVWQQTGALNSIDLVFPMKCLYNKCALNVHKSFSLNHKQTPDFTLSASSSSNIIKDVIKLHLLNLIGVILLSVSRRWKIPFV